MPITDTARKNHEELFPNHRSTLKLTDPELIEVFDNFAFDEVLRHGNLDTETRLMAILASLIAQQTLSEYKVNLGLGVDDKGTARDLGALGVVRLRLASAPSRSYPVEHHAQMFAG